MLLEKGDYEVDTKLVATRDLYMQQMPDDVDVVPEYVGGLVDFLNTTQNGADAERVTRADPDETLKAAEPLLDKAEVSLPEPATPTEPHPCFSPKATNAA